MADFSALKQSIQNYIKQNGNKEITGAILQNILLSMVTTMGDGAINGNASDISDIKDDIQNINGDITDINGDITDINGAITNINGDITDLNRGLSDEKNRAEGAESTLQQNITAEKNRAEGAETTTLLFSDGKLVFKNAAGTVLYQLSVDSFLSAITTRLNTGALYAGFATPSTTPAALTGQEVFYLATQAGTYTNFHFNGGDEPIVLTKDGIYFIVSGDDDDDWNAEPMLQLDDVPTASSNNAVKSGGVAEELALGAVYDVSAKNPTAGPNNDGKWESLSALLSDANLNTLIPTSVRKGGMSIKFVCSSDNKYIQARCMADEWGVDTKDWAIAEEGVYVENPEFIYVKTDNEDKILWAIKKDGDIYYGVGCPQQIKDYIEEKISSLSLDEYEDIVAFLSDYLGSDTTLKAIIDGINAQIPTKVDKEEGKSLIDEDFAEDVPDIISIIENPEYLSVETDSGNKVLGGRKVDGTKVENCPIETPVSKVSYIDNSEWLEVKTDKDGRIIEGIRKDGSKYNSVKSSDAKNNVAINCIYNKDILMGQQDEIDSVNEDVSLLDSVKRGTTQDTVNISLTSSTNRKVLLNLHKASGSNMEAYNNVYLPNAADDFSDVKIKDEKGHIIPYHVISRLDVDLTFPVGYPNLGLFVNSKGELFGGAGGRRLLKSTDNGLTWQQMTQFVQYAEGTMFIVYIADDDTLFFSTPSKLYKSAYPYTEATMVIDTNDPTEYNALTGKSLSSIGGCFIMPEQFVKFGNDYYLAGYQERNWIRIYKSSDGGNTWTLNFSYISDLDYPDNPAMANKWQHVHALYVDTINTPNAIYAGCDTEGHTYKTTDGVNWTDIWNSSWKRSTDYGVIYAGEGFRLLGGETSIKGGATIQKTTNDNTLTPVLENGHGCTKIVKFGKYLIANIISTKTYLSSGLWFSEDNGLTWKSAYYIPRISNGGANDGYRCSMKLTINDESIIYFGCQGYTNNAILVRDGNFSQILVDVPNGCNTLTVESGYLKGNIKGIYNNKKEANLLLDMPFNENADIIAERIKENVFTGNYNWINIGRSVGDIWPRITSNVDKYSFSIDNTIQGFDVGELDLSHGFHIGLWTRPTKGCFWKIIEINGHNLTIGDHQLRLDNKDSVFLSMVNSVVTGTLDRIDINVSSNGTVVVYTNGELYSNDTIDGSVLLTEGKAKICEYIRMSEAVPVQHLTISTNQITQEDALYFYNSGLSDNH